MDHETGAPTDAQLARLASVNLNLLVPLLALLEEKSVTRAATRIGLSQPAMSHALRRMRRLLGDELIVRQGNTMTLTSRAVQLLGPLRQALQETARIVNFPSFDPALDTRTISVAMTSSTAVVVGDSIARLTAEQAPHATLRLRTGTALSEAMFTDEGVDVMLLPETFPTQLPRERLYDNRWVVITGPDAPAGADAAELLTSLPHVVWDGAAQRVPPYAVLDERGVPYRVRDLVSEYLLVPQIVARSGGVAVHGYRVATALQASLGLRIEEFPFPVQSLGIDMIWNPWLVDDRFRSWLRGILRAAAEPAGS